MLTAVKRVELYSHLCLCLFPICAGENIFNLIKSELESRNIPWANCIAFGTDNAANMTGQHKGVIAFLKRKNDSMFLAGCCLHLIHLAAKKGSGALPVSVDDVLVDIYYFFDKSDKRQAEFRQFQDLCDKDQRRMLKHGATRWLSIGRCVKRLLENWEPLKLYFKHQKESYDSTQSAVAGKRI